MTLVGVGGGKRRGRAALKALAFTVAATRPKIALAVLRADLPALCSACLASMTSPGVEPGLSRPQRDVLTTRR